MISSPTAPASPDIATDGVRVPFAVEDAPWGFTVVHRGADEPVVRVVQLVLVSLGAASLAGALALLWPRGGEDGTFVLRLGLAALIGPAAIALIAYASRGWRPEVQIDHARGEVRVVLRNAFFSTSRIASHGFDAIAGVALEEVPGRPGTARLSLRLVDADEPLPVAWGAAVALAGLKRRLERHLLPGAPAKAAVA